MRERKRARECVRGREQESASVCERKRVRVCVRGRGGGKANSVTQPNVIVSILLFTSTLLLLLSQVNILLSECFHICC